MSDNDFEFKYVAPTTEERKHIENIRNKYLPKDADLNKLERLEKLDSIVKNLPTMIALIVGIIGVLIFGLGFAMILEWNIIVWGILVAGIGIIITIIAYPTYLKINKYLKNKYSKEILEISDELLNDGNERL